MPTTESTTAYVLESVRRREERLARELEEELVILGESTADVIARVCRQSDRCESFAE